MKLRTELLLTNVVLLVALWYTAMHFMIWPTIILFTLMIGVRIWSLMVRKREVAQETARVRAIITKSRMRRAKDSQ